MALQVGQEGKLDPLIYDRYYSAILEMFEFIKIEDIKSLCSYVATMLDKITYVQTFKALRMRHDQH
jgi:protein phosphatase-4 regulatory subunit 3